jgi:hypothetical protein
LVYKATDKAFVLQKTFWSVSVLNTLDISLRPTPNKNPFAYPKKSEVRLSLPAKSKTWCIKSSSSSSQNFFKASLI